MEILQSHRSLAVVAGMKKRGMTMQNRQKSNAKNTLVVTGKKQNLPTL